MDSSIRTSSSVGVRGSYLKGLEKGVVTVARRLVSVDIAQGQALSKGEGRRFRFLFNGTGVHCLVHASDEKLVKIYYRNDPVRVADVWQLVIELELWRCSAICGEEGALTNPTPRRTSRLK